MPDEAPPSSGNSAGLDPKVASLLAYLLGLVGGIVFYAISKDSYVRFHSMQSIMLWIALIIIYAALAILGFVVPFLALFEWVVYLGGTAIWIVMMVKAYQGDRYKLPIIGDMAEKYAK